MKIINAKHSTHDCRHTCATLMDNAEIYAAEYNKKHTNKILHGHQITFSELYYRWLPFHIDKYQPSKSTINSYQNSYKHCLPIHEMPLKNIKYYHLQQIIDDTKRKGLSYSSCKKIPLSN